MAPLREIPGSDDEDSGFSPVKSPQQLRGPASPEEPQPDCLADPQTRSTDPDFFQSVYNEQQNAAATDRLGYRTARAEDDNGRTDYNDGVTHDNSMGDAVSLPGTMKKPLGKGGAVDATNTSSLTSITDPGTAKRQATVRNSREFVDLTQVTTPRKSGSGVGGSVQDDIWEVPTSQDPRPRTSAAKGKRKRGETGESDADNSSPRLFQKKSKGAGPETSSQDVPQSVYMVATQDEVPNVPAGKSTRLGLYLSPSRLTNSQKKAYAAVEVPWSCPEIDDHEASRLFPTPKFDHDINLRSSEATVAMSTPSAFGSSGRKLPQDVLSPEQGPLVSTGKRKRARRDAGQLPPSSPDVIAGPAASAMDSEPEPTELRDDSWESRDGNFREGKSDMKSCVQTIAAPDELPDTQPPLLACMGVPNAVTAVTKSARDEVPIFTISSDHETPGQLSGDDDPPRPQKQRRRKKKNLPEPEYLAADIGEEGAQEPEPNKKPKRRRGRPKKPETAGLTDNVKARQKRQPEEPKESGDAGILYQDHDINRAHANDVAGGLEQTVEEGARAPNKAKKRGRKRAAGKTGDGEPDDGFPAEMGVLVETSHNASCSSQPRSASASGADTTTGGEMEANENGVEEGQDKLSRPSTVKDAVGPAGKDATNKAGLNNHSSSSQQGKVPLRVGLSKRSRIAPLLKSLRK